MDCHPPYEVSDLEESDGEREEQPQPQHPVPEPEPEAVAAEESEQEPAGRRVSKRKRSDSITSISDDDGDSSEEQPDENFGARAPVHPSQMGDLLPPMFSRDRGLELHTYKALKKADARGDLDARLKILKELERASFGRRR